MQYQPRTLSIRELKIMESRLSWRRLCGGEEFGTGLVTEGRIEIREKTRGRGLVQGQTLHKDLVAGNNLV